MITAGGPRVLEFNVRFGDPEAQVTLPLLKGDFGEACYACARGELEEGMLSIDERHALFLRRGKPRYLPVAVDELHQAIGSSCYRGDRALHVLERLRDR